jgi:hypothetical protein
VGRVYKGWGVENNNNSSYKLWDNKGKSQIKYV